MVRERENKMEMCIFLQNRRHRQFLMVHLQNFQDDDLEMHYGFTISPAKCKSIRQKLNALSFLLDIFVTKYKGNVFFLLFS